MSLCHHVSHKEASEDGLSGFFLVHSYSPLNAHYKCHLCSKMHERLDPTSWLHGAWHPGGTQWLFLSDLPLPRAFFC